MWQCSSLWSHCASIFVLKHRKCQMKRSLLWSTLFIVQIISGVFDQHAVWRQLSMPSPLARKFGNRTSKKDLEKNEWQSWATFWRNFWFSAETDEAYTISRTWLIPGQPHVAQIGSSPRMIRRLSRLNHSGVMGPSHNDIIRLSVALRDLENCIDRAVYTTESFVSQVT